VTNFKFKGDDAQIAWDLDMISQRARVIVDAGGRAAYDAYALDLFRAGDRHMVSDPITREGVTNGHWWIKDAAGEMFIVKVGGTNLQSVTFPGDDEAWTVQEMLDVDAVFVCKIPEPD
jgi:hypothetical protein